LNALRGDVKYWIDNKTCHFDETAVRMHHRLVQIHPFPNGNGRHARLIADVIVVKLGRKWFTWGRENLVLPGAPREAYIAALKTANRGDIQPLIKFARS